MNENVTRIDGKKSNTKKDPETVSAIKTLFIRGMPAKLIAEIFDVAESTVYMLGLNARQANIEPMSDYKAVCLVNAKFKEIVDSSIGV